MSSSLLFPLSSPSPYAPLSYDPSRYLNSPSADDSPIPRLDGPSAPPPRPVPSLTYSDWYSHKQAEHRSIQKARKASLVNEILSTVVRKQLGESAFQQWKHRKLSEYNDRKRWEQENERMKMEELQRLKEEKQRKQRELKQRQRERERERMMNQNSISNSNSNSNGTSSMKALLPPSSSCDPSQALALYRAPERLSKNRVAFQQWKARKRRSQRQKESVEGRLKREAEEKKQRVELERRREAVLRYDEWNRIKQEQEEKQRQLEREQREREQQKQAEEKRQRIERAKEMERIAIDTVKQWKTQEQLIKQREQEKRKQRLIQRKQQNTILMAYSVNKKNNNIVSTGNTNSQ